MTCQQLLDIGWASVPRTVITTATCTYIVLRAVITTQTVVNIMTVITSFVLLTMFSPFCLLLSFFISTCIIVHCFHYSCLSLTPLVHSSFSILSCLFSWRFLYSFAVSLVICFGAVHFTNGFAHACSFLQFSGARDHNPRKPCVLRGNNQCLLLAAFCCIACLACFFLQACCILLYFVLRLFRFKEWCCILLHYALCLLCSKNVAALCCITC